MSPATLYAYDPEDLSQEIYSSDEAANGRDQLAAVSRFTVPTVANGKVYLATGSSVSVFGLFDPPHLANLSSRAQVGTADNVLIAGFIVQGSAPRTLVVRGIGPSLEVSGSELAGALPDPMVELFDSSGTMIALNDNWMDSPQKDEIIGAQLAPGNPLESAIFATLDPGAYTAVMRGVNGATGVGLVELYDVSAAQNSTLVNFSSRGMVGTGDNVMIGGVIVAGVAPQKVIIRALGPDLADSGVAGPLADPTLELHDVNGVLLASNDNWRSDQETDIAGSGLQPGNDLDAAIIETLPASGYTAVVRGASGTTGVALLEAYALR